MHISILIISWNVQKNSRNVAEFFGRILRWYSANFLEDIKNGVSDSYFVKIKTFRLQISKLLGNRRRAYILSVICNEFCLVEVQDRDSGRSPSLVSVLSKVSHHQNQKVCLSIISLFQKKTEQVGWGNAF